jgi:hypothetical protein
MANLEYENDKLIKCINNISFLSNLLAASATGVEYTRRIEVEFIDSKGNVQ